MKLLYDMPPADQAVFEQESAGETLMYCLPFNMLDDKFVNGFVAFTNKKMYKILDGKLLAVYDIIGASDFKTEVMYGSGGFYAKIDGSSTLICQFVVGRNLPRYAVIARACEILNETGDETPLVNKSPERFCLECGRPYLYGSQICPFCMKKLDVYMKLWAMTKGLRLAMFFPFIVAGVMILVQFVMPVLQRHITDTYLVPKAETVESLSDYEKDKLIADLRTDELLQYKFMEIVLHEDTFESWYEQSDREELFHNLLAGFEINEDLTDELLIELKNHQLYLELLQKQSFWDFNPIIGFGWLVAVLVLIDLFQRALGVTEARLLAIASGKFLMMLRTLLYEKIQTLSLSSIHRRSTGELMTRVSRDTQIMQHFIIREFPNIFRQLISLPVAVLLLFILNWVVALFVLVPIPFALFIIRSFWGYIHNKNRRFWMADARLYYILQDVLNGIRVVKSFGQEDKEIERFDNVSLEVARQDEKITQIWSTIWPFITFLINASVYFIIYYAGSLVIAGPSAGGITLGEYNQYFAYTNIVYGPLMALANIPNSISRFLTSSSKVFEILEETPEITDIDLPLDIKIEGNISIKKATFGYQSYNPVLENVTLDIKAGQMIGIVGHSGSGKSTLINLLMRLYDVNEGEILIDDVNIRDISQEALRSQIGIVLQETHLFTGTVRENIRYSKPYASDEEVIEAARVANAHDFIVNLPDGYNTLVGEKGYSMSGGERQRVAIARAVIHNPTILILDEATASLDTETEKLIQDALNKLSENRTTIAIAHRLSTLRNADKLLVLDKGKVAEYGTHSELLDQQGIYYKLVMAQREMAHQIVGDEGEE